ncbi:Serine protease 55 [Chionoecetes opilio]|uniref:Serine protease 55 n=1 Tax=Chionoecetes opilio TaxID=41210 RepID=A0A8J4YCI0_CHIOP|nr:Serine protease 55 [Chionoecetes opilio]
MLQITGRRKYGYPRPGHGFRRPTHAFRRPESNNRRRRPRPNRNTEEDSRKGSGGQRDGLSAQPTAAPAVSTLEWGVPDLTNTLFGSYMGDRTVFSNRITYGFLAGTREFPWQVGMVVGEKFHCGACIIGEQWILTAAHCVVSYKNTPHKLILNLGDWDLSTTNDGPSLNITPESVTVHPQYSRATLQNDLAILRLPSKIKFTDDIKPICLPTEGEFLGDSGGPSVMEIPEGSGNYVLVGLVSFGSGSCVDAQLPGVYTKVTHYRDWITSNMV